MNYRHHFHAGNFADVMKHALLLRILRALQNKPKGVLYLDTHAGRGRYDLAAAATGDSLARKPEWPEGIGRLWSREGPMPPLILDYLTIVRACDRGSGAVGESIQFYPGSPWIARAASRPVDRLALCEQQPEECAALRQEMAGTPRLVVQEIDGYVALRAMLPPPERRAVVLIDPPFEAQDEFAQIATGLGQVLERLPSAVVAIWYPLTGRARVNEFFDALRSLPLPPTLAAELMIAGEQSPIKMKGCGLVVVNPPWQLEQDVQPALDFLAEALAQAPGGSGRIEWLVRE